MSMQTVGALSAYARLDGVDLTQATASPDRSANFAAIFDKADTSIQGFATGAIDAQSVVEALSQAEMALQMAVTVRDRVVGAYQELLRMPL